MSPTRAMRDAAIVVVALGMSLVMLSSVMAQPQVEIDPSPTVQGTQQIILGTGFEPDTTYRLAILNEAGEEIFADQITTNAGGNFSFDVTSEPSDPPGEYALVVTPVGGGEELASTTWTLQAPGTATPEAATEAAPESDEATPMGTDAPGTSEEAEPTDDEEVSTAVGTAEPVETGSDADDGDDGIFESRWSLVVGLLLVVIIAAIYAVSVRRRARP